MQQSKEEGFEPLISHVKVMTILLLIIIILKLQTKSKLI